MKTSQEQAGLFGDPGNIASKEDVQIPAGGVNLEATLTLPHKPRGIVIFAHGSGSGRHSPRNQFVAKQLQDQDIATLLADLLTKEEEDEDLATGQFRFDIPLLAGRLIAITSWVGNHPAGATLPIGLFGSSTGAAAALITAAEHTKVIKAVVSRGGRPDLAKDWLPKVLAPTLLIVGGNDTPVIKLNEEAMPLLATGTKELAVIQGATHLFEEPNALEKATLFATDWFLEYLRT